MPYDGPTPSRYPPDTPPPDIRDVAEENVKLIGQKLAALKATDSIQALAQRTEEADGLRRELAISINAFGQRQQVRAPLPPPPRAPLPPRAPRPPNLPFDPPAPLPLEPYPP